MSSLEVVAVDPAAEPGWDGFVSDHPQATAYHLAAWVEILRSSYRFQPLCRVLRDEAGTVRGVLPLLLKRGPISGRQVHSLPVVPTGGPLAEDAAGARMLARDACELARERRCALIIRSRLDSLADAHAGIDAYPRPPSWVLGLDGFDEREWLSSRRSNLRRSVNIAERSGLRFRESDSEEDLRRFYHLYLVTMRGHGKLPRLYRQLRLSREALGPPGVFRLFVVEDESRMVAGGVFHAFGNTVELLYNASDRRALKSRPNHLLYRRVMAWARQHAYDKLDFGFAWPGTSLGAFKAQWGAEPLAEHGYCFAPEGSRARAGTGRPAPTEADPAIESDARLVERAWAKAPLSATRVAATLVYRYL